MTIDNPEPCFTNIGNITAFGAMALMNNLTANSSAFGYGVLTENTTGYINSGFGTYALHSNVTGSTNTALGNHALMNNVSGSNNLAIGDSAGENVIAGNYNISIGAAGSADESGVIRIGNSNHSTAYIAGVSGVTTGLPAQPVVIDANGQLGTSSPTSVATLQITSDSYQNTAIGPTNLGQNQPSGGDPGTGQANTAGGTYALASNTTGQTNTAFGTQSMYLNTTGSVNNAFGQNAMWSNTTGSSNNAFGGSALYSNTTGSNNTAFGAAALAPNQGSNNTAVGYAAFVSKIAGDSNVAIGYQAGVNLQSGSSNIYINTYGGSATESGVIRIGDGNQTQTFISGIWGATPGATQAGVLIDNNGQLGTMLSSRRYKEDIQPMADASERLLKLRPVTFRYKKPNAQGEKPVQYGLIAEEVAEVFPELVVYNKEGKPETVAYHLLASLLLNELQKEHSQSLNDHEQLAEERRHVAALESQSAAVNFKLEALERIASLLAKANGLDPDVLKAELTKKISVNQTSIAAK